MSAAVYLEAPLVTTPRVGGLLPVAQVADFSTPHEAAGVDWVPSPCGPAALAPGVCDSVIDVPDEPKEFEGIPFVSNGPFGVYKGVVCDLREDWTDRARQALELGEPTAVELAFQQVILNGSDTDVIASGVSPTAAVALLEQYAANVYGGRPVFHVSRFGAVVLAAEDLADPELNFNLVTKQGSPVGNGAYGATGPGDVDAASGQFWLYATGAVFLRKGPLVATTAPDVRGNEAYALAERIWVPAAECFVAAVLVDSGLEVGS